MPENLLSMQISHIRYTNMDFFKTPHIQIQLLGKDPVFKYEFLVLFIYPWFLEESNESKRFQNNEPEEAKTADCDGPSDWVG